MLETLFIWGLIIFPLGIAVVLVAYRARFFVLGIGIIILVMMLIWAVLRFGMTIGEDPGARFADDRVRPAVCLLFEGGRPLDGCEP